MASLITGYQLKRKWHTQLLLNSYQILTGDNPDGLSPYRWYRNNSDDLKMVNQRI